MRHARLAFTLMILLIGGVLWTSAGTADPGETTVVLTPFGESVRDAGPDALTAPSDMSAWIKTAQARCPPGQLLFLTSACGCNGACCACSPQVPYLDHCSCKCSASPATSCRIGISAGRR